MREYTFFRLIGGNKIPWKLVVDDSNIVINEGPNGLPDENKVQVAHPIDEEVVPAEGQEVTPVLRPDGGGITPAGEEMLRKRGIKFHKTPEGQLVVEHVPKREQIIARFFNTEECPEDIPNCEKVRADYERAVEDAGGKNCKGCQLNKIRNKYRAIIQKLLETEPVMQ